MSIAMDTAAPHWWKVMLVMTAEMALTFTIAIRYVSILSLSDAYISQIGQLGSTKATRLRSLTNTI